MLNNCTMTGNGADTGAGASRSTLNNCTLTGNEAEVAGGGASSCTLDNCTLTGNGAGSGGGAFGSTLNNCTVTGNGASGGGGASSCTLNNCTLTGNGANNGGGASGSTLSNCIVYYNTAYEEGANYLDLYNRTTILDHCCTTPLPTNGIGNIEAEPVFMDPGAGDYHLQLGSPGINAGLNQAWMAEATDLDGNARVRYGMVDMGAFEYAGPPLAITRQPQGGIVTAGTTLTLDVEAVGIPVLSYQWLFEGANVVDDLRISGATTPSLTLSDVQCGDAGAYSVVVGNAFGSATSVVAHVAIPDTIPPILHGVPADATRTCGQVPAPAPVTATDNYDPVPSLTLTEVRTAGNWPSGPTLYILNRTWTATDASTNSVVSNQTITVVNSCPAALGQAVHLCEDTPAVITLTASHVDGACVPTTLSYQVVTPPRHGILSGTPPNLTYTPASDYGGPDSFVFKVSDGLCESSDATVSIAVEPVNDPPVCRMVVGPLVKLTPDSTDAIVVATNNRTAPVVLDGSLSSDIDSSTLTFVWLANGVPIGTGPLLTNSLGVGAHQITLVVDDGGTGTAPGCVNGGGTDSCSRTVTVMTGAQAVEEVASLLDGTTLDRKTKRSFIATLKAGCSSFDRQNCVSAVNQLEAFQNKVRAQITKENPVAAQFLIGAAQAVIDAYQPCEASTLR